MRALFAALIALAVAAPAAATDFVVTKTADTADGTCNADCSLREAIIAANNNPGPDRVILGTGLTYTLTLGPADAPTALVPASGDLDITDSLTIVGNSSVINGNNLDRVFDISGPISVTFEYVTITGGAAKGFLSFGGGIQIRNASVTLIGTSVVSNQAALESDSRDAGGGIAVIGSFDPANGGMTIASLTAYSSVINNNLAGYGAGILCVLCSLSLNDTLLNINVADHDGAGIDVLGDRSTTSGISSLLVSNLAYGRGGGIAAPFGASTNTWTRSSFAANQAVTGPAIFNSAASVSALNNWWGCNYGPGATGAGCVSAANGVAGVAAASTTPYIVAKASAAPAQFLAGSVSTITVDTTFNSSNVDISPGGTLSGRAGALFQTSFGTLSSSGFVNFSGGKGTNSLTTAAAGDPVVTATVDYQQLTVPLVSTLPSGFDFDGDHTGDLAVYNHATGAWSIAKSSSGYASSLTITDGGPGSLPVSADFDGDGRKDVAVYKFATGTWTVLTSSSNFTTMTTQSWGGPGYLPVAADFDGDGKADFGVYQPATGAWSILLSGANFTTVLSKTWGGPGYLPIAGDFDGDGHADIGVYRKTTGQWSILKSRSGYTSVLSLSWGGPGYVPAPADYDGDGKIDAGVYALGTGTFYVLTSSSGFTSTLSGAVGGPSSTPVPGDFDGDGKADFAVYQQSTGGWTILKSTTGYSTSMSFTFGGSQQMAVVPTLPYNYWSDTSRNGDLDGDTRSDIVTYNTTTGAWVFAQSGTAYVGTTTKSWGGTGYTPVPGDYDGDGRADIAVYFASTGVWSILKSSTNFTTTMSVSLGGTGWQPVEADFDGDGRTDVAVYQSSTGLWAVLTSSSGFTSGFNKSWGGAGYEPIPVDFDGDGKADLGTYVQSTGMWYALTSSSGFTASVSRSWGGTGYLAAAADYDGDGRADYGVFEVSTGTYYVLLSSSGFTTSLTQSFGGAGFTPVLGDYDGDGHADPAIYDPSTSTWTIRTSSSGYVSTITRVLGGAGTIPLPAFY
jgi:CSLREA domain-containing protein